MFLKRIPVIIDTLFTLPKPLLHLFVTLLMLCSKELLEDGNAYIDLMSVFNTLPSCWIPNRSNTTETMIVIANKTLQVIHLALLTLVHHLCAPFCFHWLGPVLRPCVHSSSMNHRSAKHIPLVVGSEVLKKELMASPRVTSVGSRDLIIVIIIAHALTRLQQITTIMIPSENCTLHFSSTISLLHPLTSTSSSLSVTRHGSPFATIEVISPAHPFKASMELGHIQRVGEVSSPRTRFICRTVLSNMSLEGWLVIKRMFLWFDTKSVL